jgi:hypothetical protein
MSARPRESARALVHRAVEQLWASRGDGRWSARENALIVALDRKKLPERRVRERRENVIELSDYFGSRRRA